MDVESYQRWHEYTEVYDRMIRATDSKHAPWYRVDADVKKKARLQINLFFDQAVYYRFYFCRIPVNIAEEPAGDFSILVNDEAYRNSDSLVIFRRLSSRVHQYGIGIFFFFDEGRYFLLVFI